MTEQKDLAIVEQRELTPAVWSMIREMAPVMHESRLFGVSSPQQAAAIMLKGYELGLSITASFELVQVVQGKPTLSPRGAMALLHNSPEIKTIQVNRMVNGGKFEGYECTMKRHGGFEYTARWTMEDARRAGLIKPDSAWANYPENMCMWRAIGFAADVVAPDITAGMTGLMKMPEQFGVGLTAEGDIIDAPVAKPCPPAAATEIGLNDLLAMYSPEQIMAANGGAIPGTQDEINNVVVKLAGGKHD